ncbi:hypothetical protein KDL01_22245 [Actinospica durhamensis]|uniref:Uncharacterized protein n=1 Tax=Actinospica durhamensis TaxID=1508375 RepID=A0A941ET57_9ACTN|nr:hypothetical protein [Actinospica durhamensis]MBR7836013.1 hypothetical protein [Actinospica durhamensis]
MPEKVKRQAYATDCHPPIDAAEARRLAELHLVPEAGLPPDTSLRLTEFASCFTVTKLVPPPPVGTDGIPLHPTEPGRGVVVIDKETGAFSFWPSLAEISVAEAFTAAKAAGGLEYVADWPAANT